MKELVVQDKFLRAMNSFVYMLKIVMKHQCHETQMKFS